MIRDAKGAPSAKARRLLAGSISETRAQMRLISKARKALEKQSIEDLAYDDARRATVMQQIKEMGSTTAALARAQNSAAAELRKIDTYDAVAARKLSPQERYELILAYVDDEMTRDYRQKLIEHMRQLEADESSVMGGA